MPGNDIPPDASLPEVERDESWYAERRVEVLRSMAEVERNTLITNILGTAGIVLIAQMLPNADSFIIPAIFRFVAILLTTLVYEAMRNRLARGASITGTYRACIFVGILGGASWALLILPVFVEPHFHPAAYLVAAGALIATSLVITNTSSLPQIWISFCLSYLAVFWTGMTAAPEPFRLPVSIGITIIIVAIAGFGIGAARHRIFAADMLVENRRMGETLAEALAEAKFLAQRDPLTGLFNRRAMFEISMSERVPVERQHIFLIDIDHFKQVNDRFGHNTGDQVLIRIAQVLRDLIRELPGEGHCAARVGGEEFAIFLAMEDSDNADRIAEKVRKSIAGVAEEFAMPEGLGTASIGVSTFLRSERIGDALQRADNALYEAKTAGRNAVRRQEAA